MRKVIIAVDSFKGCLSSTEIADAVAEGIAAVFPSCETVKVPIADGGEGTVEALTETTGGELIAVTVHNPFMQPVLATYGIMGDRHTAVIEMSAASGLSLIPWAWGNIMRTTTYGTGELIADAIRHGCRNFILGIGGSATNDAGLGMMQALGVRLLDKSGKELGQGGEIMQQIETIDVSGLLPELADSTFHIATDVSNPFCGPQGAAHIFGPQKGGNNYHIEHLDVGMKHLAALIRKTTCKDIENIPGAGAGGGMGGGCVSFLQAEINSGIELITRYIRFDDMIKGADLIITGEGKMDNQTLFGKVPVGVARSASKQHIPVVAITGNVECDKGLAQAGITAIFPIHPAPVTLQEAMQPEYARTQIRRTIEQICHLVELREER